MSGTLLSMSAVSPRLVFLLKMLNTNGQVSKRAGHSFVDTQQWHGFWKRFDSI
jgi:hypothetical protein